MKYYTPADDQFLRDTYGKLTIKQQAKQLGRSESAINCRRCKLKLVSPLRKWTKAEDAIILGSNKSYKELAEQLARTEGAVVQRALRLGGHLTPQPTKPKGRPKRVKSIEEIAVLAKAAGMNYGEYVARMGL